MENAKELFVKAFMEAERLDNANLPREDEIQWDFSEKFLKSMDKLIRKNNRINFSARRNIRKSLLAAVIAIMVLFTGLMSVSATRTPIIEFVKKIFPQFNEITLSPEAAPPVETIETEYTLTDLPEGYVLDTYKKDEYRVFSVWKNKAGEEIVLTQALLDSNFSIDTEHEYKEIIMNGYEACLNKYEYNSTLTWTDGNYWFTLNVPNSLNDGLTDLAKNISEKN